MLERIIDRILKKDVHAAGSRYSRMQVAVPQGVPIPQGDAPPPYSSEKPPTTTATGPLHTGSTNSDTDRYAFLRTFDTIFVIDDSGSMAGRLWKETGKALEAITPVCTQRDDNGIDVYFLNHKRTYNGIKNCETVIDIFQNVQPQGATPTGQRLDKILRPYLSRYEKLPDSTKPINVIVITDGAADDDVEAAITMAARKLDKLDAPPWQIGIQFFQVGNDLQAREELTRLDNELRRSKDGIGLRDIVDTVPFSNGNATLTADGILKVVLGAVNRKWDRESEGLHGHTSE